MAAPSHIARSLIAGEAGNIEISTQVPQTIRAVAVVAHPHPLFGGTMENKVTTTLARAFCDAGAATYRFNFRGVGKTEGTHDEGRGETSDMLTVAAAAQAHQPGLPLWLGGFSFGGAVALAASEKVAASEMILVAPAFQRLSHWQDVATGGAAPPSTLVIHGETDDVVPLSDSFDWARTRDISVLVVPGADHFFHQRLHLIRSAVGRWLA